jgi:hypothetical protein
MTGVGGTGGVPSGAIPHALRWPCTRRDVCAASPGDV